MGGSAKDSRLIAKAMFRRLQGYLLALRTQPRDLLARLRDRVVVALHALSGGLLFPNSGYRGLLRDGELLGPVGMTTAEERAFLAWLARDRYQGEGAIVELGPFVGASTVALCRGVADNRTVPASAKKVRVYDLFKCDQFMADWINQSSSAPALAGCLKRPLKPGDSSLPVFEHQTARYSHMIDLHHGDLLSFAHDGAPIEMLFVDVMKTHELAEHVVRKFFPALVPGKSVLVQQDFVHFWTSWIHLIQYDLRDYFRFEFHVPNSASVVFRFVKPLPSLRDYRLNLDGRTDAEVDSAFDYSLSLVRGELRESVLAAKATHYLHAGHRDRCEEMVEHYLHDHPDARHDMVRLAEHLRENAAA